MEREVNARMEPTTQRTRIIQHIRNRYGAEPEYLWIKYPNTAAFRHPVGGKWFALVTEVARNKLGLSGSEIAHVINVKCDPIMVGSLLSEAGFFPAYHMNKNSWISILLDSGVPDEKIAELLELSYDAVAPKRKR